MCGHSLETSLGLLGFQNSLFKWLPSLLLRLCLLHSSVFPEVTVPQVDQSGARICMIMLRCPSALLGPVSRLDSDKMGSLWPWDQILSHCHSSAERPWDSASKGDFRITLKTYLLTYLLGHCYFIYEHLDILTSIDVLLSGPGPYVVFSYFKNRNLLSPNFIPCFEDLLEKGHLSFPKKPFLPSGEMCIPGTDNQSENPNSLKY